MLAYPEDIKKMIKKFEPYLEWQDDGTYGFKPGTPLEIKQLRKKCLERVTQYQIEMLS